MDHCFPEYDIWTQFVSADYTRALDLDALDSSHPIEVNCGGIPVLKLKAAGSCSLLGRMFLHVATSDYDYDHRLIFYSCRQNPTHYGNYLFNLFNECVMVKYWLRI